jgi:hypothetical protein
VGATDEDGHVVQAASDGKKLDVKRPIADVGDVRNDRKRAAKSHVGEDTAAEAG